MGLSLLGWGSRNSPPSPLATDAVAAAARLNCKYEIMQPARRPCPTGSLIFADQRAPRKVIFGPANRRGSSMPATLRNNHFSARVILCAWWVYMGPNSHFVLFLTSQSRHSQPMNAKPSQAAHYSALRTHLKNSPAAQTSKINCIFICGGGEVAAAEVFCNVNRSQARFHHSLIQIASK
jgi:hypothetical protein